MSDVPVLSDSKFYAMAQTNPLFSWLIPSLETKMITEEILSEDYPRTDDEEGQLRVFIQYVNTNQNSSMFKLVGSYNVDTTNFALDDFLSGYMQEVIKDGLPEDEVSQLEILSLQALTYAVSVVIGIEEVRGTDPEKMKHVCRNFIGCFIATLYGTPLDVYIIATDREDEVSGEEIFELRAMWLVKSAA